MASNMKVFGTEAGLLGAEPVSPLAGASQRVSCFFLPSTLRRGVASEGPEQIRTITRTCRPRRPER